MKVFWNVAPCSSVEIKRRFIGAFCLHHNYHIIIALMMEAVSTSETSINFYGITRRNIPEDSHLQKPSLSQAGGERLYIDQCVIIELFEFSLEDFYPVRAIRSKSIHSGDSYQWRIAVGFDSRQPIRDCKNKLEIERLSVAAQTPDPNMFDLLQWCQR
jgi:hypothetical protein